MAQFYLKMYFEAYCICSFIWDPAKLLSYLILFRVSPYHDRYFRDTLQTVMIPNEVTLAHKRQGHDLSITLNFETHSCPLHASVITIINNAPYR